MKIVQSVKMSLTAVFLIASILGSPILAHAEDGENRSDVGTSWPWQVSFVDNTNSSTSTTTDDVFIDGQIITAENYDAAAASTDSEWKYVPVRRMADTGGETAPAEELVTEGEGETAIANGVTVLAWARVDGVGLDDDSTVADDFVAEPGGDEGGVVQIPIRIKYDQ